MSSSNLQVLLDSQDRHVRIEGNFLIVEYGLPVVASFKFTLFSAEIPKRESMGDILSAVEQNLNTR